MSISTHTHTNAHEHEHILKPTCFPTEILGASHPCPHLSLFSSSPTTKATGTSSLLQYSNSRHNAKPEAGIFAFFAKWFEASSRM